MTHNTHTYTHTHTHTHTHKELLLMRKIRKPAEKIYS